MMRPGAPDWQQPDRLPTLDATSVHVWRAALDQPDELVAGLAAHLSPEEEFRVCGYQRPLDRRRFILCRGLLRRLLGAYLSRPPSTIGFTLGPQGKPRLARSAAVPDLRFNVSHSESVALFAVALGREVGVDLEHVRPLVEAET
ncbi:MAG: 4'-phosphopantetheinyl transferase family protein, partial [Candidatus Sericytochromatia bacterium]